MNSTCLRFRKNQDIQELNDRLALIENNKQVLDSVVSSLYCLYTGKSDCGDNNISFSPIKCPQGTSSKLTITNVTPSAGVAISSTQVSITGATLSTKPTTNIGTTDTDGNFTYTSSCDWTAGAVGNNIYVYINGNLEGSVFVINSEADTSSTTTPSLVLSKANSTDECGYSSCKYTLNVVGWNSSTQLVASTGQTFNSNPIYGAKDSSNPNAFSINLASGSLYYLRATNPGGVFSNVVTINAVKTTSVLIPTIIEPYAVTYTSPYDAGTTNYSTAWSCSNGTVDNGTHTPYSQVSKNSDFSTTDGVAGTNDSNGGKVVVYSDGTFYMRVSNDNKTWSTTRSFTFKNDGSGSSTSSGGTDEIPIININPTNLEAVGYPSRVEWSSMNISGPIAQVSLKSDFSTTDGSIAVWVPNGGDIIFNGPGVYYVRFKSNGYSGPGDGWSTVSKVTVTTKDVSGLVLATPTLTKAPNSDTALVIKVPQNFQTAPYGVYTGYWYQLSTDAQLSNIINDSKYSSYNSPPNYYPSALGQYLPNASPGTTYYYRARMQISGVWTGWSAVKSFTL